MYKTIFTIFVATFSRAAASFPAPLLDPPEPEPTGIAIVAGGCFWGVEAVFDHVAGVRQAISGYAGGTRETARYERVETGRTGHAEAVEVIYDPSRISYGKLLEIFFSVAHDPTQRNRQGPDEGPQYRSAIFYLNDQQRRVAEAYIRQLNEAKIFKRRIATEVAPLPEGFFPAEAYHQHYLEHNRSNPYIMFNDLPKLRRLKRDFPELWTGE
jgi:peptide-methionine (S)-S-oxide reductase